eukprot:7652003-Ditylum_brightwellii.AAC.1
MMMMMVTDSKSPSSSISSPSLPSFLSVSPSTSPSSFIMQIKGDESKHKNNDNDALEHASARETVLHDTIMQMHNPPSPSPPMPESDKAQINKIREAKTYVKENSLN